MERHKFKERGTRCQMARPRREFVATSSERHASIRNRLRGADANSQISTRNCQAEGSILVGLQHGTNLTYGIPILTEGLSLTRGKEREVGLIVGEDAGHEFDVGAVLVGEVPVPGVTELVVAPGPLLFAGRDVMVSDVDE